MIVRLVDAHTQKMIDQVFKWEIVPRVGEQIHLEKDDGTMERYKVMWVHHVMTVKRDEQPTIVLGSALLPKAAGPFSAGH